MMLAKYVCKYLLIVCVGFVGVEAESSVFGFGTDIQDTTVVQSSSARAPSTMAQMRLKIAEQDERIDGLTTIIEGLSASLNELQMGNNKTASSSQNNENRDALLQKLAGMIDEINANYVSKKELDAQLGKNTKFKVTKKVSKDDIFSGKSNASLYSEGVRHFVKQRYSEAKKRFEFTDKKRYKPAASNYYLGEIAYYTKQYEDAIFYFKKSAGLYDQASYIDTLLLHTAVSLEKTGDRSQAKVFYENIIENYKGKKTASIAKKRLQKL